MWQVISGGWQALVRLGASVVLARTLAPGDFGLFGMALLVVELVDYLGGLGMTGGIIAKKEIGDKELNTCFWTMSGVRVTLFCIAFMSAPFAAAFMKEPRIEAVVRVVSVTFLISILGIIGNTLLSKRLQFGKISIINAIAILLESSVAVYLALTTDLGYWALVFPMLLSSFFTNVSVFIVSKWSPRLMFDKASFQFQFKFGINGLGFNIANYLHQNIDYFMVGRIMGASSLGLYEYAYRIPHIILEKLARPVGSVVFPALAKVQDDDDALIRGYVQTVRYVTVVAFPILGGLAAIAEPLVLVLWGEQWKTIILPMQILCLCTAIRCCIQPTGAVFLCKHRPEIPMKQSILSCLAAVVFVGLGIWAFGLVGVAVGMVVSTFSYLYGFSMVFKITNSSPRMLYENLAPSIVSTFVSILLAVVPGYLFPGINIIFMLVISILFGVLGYVACFYFLFRNNFKDIIDMAANVFFKNNKLLPVR